jgi:hypothetical protein
MTDWTGMAALVAPITTLAGGLGGYWLASRNEEARDKRAAQRESQSRLDALADKLEEDRHTFQRDTLLELQDELQHLVRNTAQAIMQDKSAIKERGQIYLLTGDLSDQALQITKSLQRLRSRVLDNELRDAIGDFIGTCSTASMGLTGYPNGKVPDNEQEAAVNRLDRRMRETSDAYERLTESLGVHIRRELDRRYLVSAPPRADTPGA